jgi:hypothetical protein
MEGWLEGCVVRVDYRMQRLSLGLSFTGPQKPSIDRYTCIAQVCVSVRLDFLYDNVNLRAE